MRSIRSRKPATFVATIGFPAARYSHSLMGLRLSVNGVTRCGVMQTSNPRYFAGGDCVSGGQEVVNAVAEGKRAAVGIAAHIESLGGGVRLEVARG